jgi:flagellar hook-associated protein 1 FlgK
MGGLAIAIEVNANVDPARGGNVNLLRDGGIAAPGNSAYVYNPTGAAGFTDRILQLASQMTSTQSFDPAAGLGAAGSLGGYANASVSWLQSLHQQTTDKASYEDAVATQAAAALSNATGVSLDVEMTNMLNLENTYSTTAKLLTTINAMFDALMKSI